MPPARGGTNGGNRRANLAFGAAGANCGVGWFAGLPDLPSPRCRCSESSHSLPEATTPDTSPIFSAAAGRSAGGGISSVMASLSRLDHCAASAAGILAPIVVSDYLRLVSCADEVIE